MRKRCRGDIFSDIKKIHHRISFIVLHCLRAKQKQEKLKLGMKTLEIVSTKGWLFTSPYHILASS